MSTKALRHLEGKPPKSVEQLDREMDARTRAASTNPVKVSVVASDSLAKASKAGEQLDQKAIADRAKQARTEQHQGSDNAQDQKEFNVRKDG
jgi:hypothetical protein